MKTAIEEGLRFNGPLKGTMRVAGEDMVIADKQVRAGDRILLLMGAANRDPAKFEDPERFDATRYPTCICHSATASTFVSALRWPGWKWKSLSTNCSRRFPEWN